MSDFFKCDVWACSEPGWISEMETPLFLCYQSVTGRVCLGFCIKKSILIILQNCSNLVFMCHSPLCTTVEW